MPSTTIKSCRARLDGLANVTYVSLLDQLCRRVALRSCLARVPGEGELDLMALDFGHLTPKGSSYLGRVVWKPYLDRVSDDEYLLPPAVTCCIFKAIGMPELPFDPPKETPRRGPAAVAASDNGATRSATAIATSSRCIPHFGSTTSAISRSAGS